MPLDTDFYEPGGTQEPIRVRPIDPKTTRAVDPLTNLGYTAGPRNVPAPLAPIPSREGSVDGRKAPPAPGGRNA